MIEILNIKSTEEYKGFELIHGYYDVLAKLPEDATNGDVIQALFPNIQWDNECNGVFYGYKTNDRMMPMLGADFNWWNAPYKGESEE